MATYINTEAQASYLLEPEEDGATRWLPLQTKINVVNAEISGASSSSGQMALLNTQHRVLAGQLDDQVRQQVQLQISGAKVPGYAILRTAQVAPRVHRAPHRGRRW